MYPCITQFCYIKVGYKGYTLHGHVFPMVGNDQEKAQSERSLYTLSEWPDFDYVDVPVKGNHYYLIPAYDFHETSYASR